MESDKWSQATKCYGTVSLDCDNQNLPFRMGKINQKRNSIPDIILGKFLLWKAFRRLTKYRQLSLPDK